MREPSPLPQQPIVCDCWWACLLRAGARPSVPSGRVIGLSQLEWQQLTGEAVGGEWQTSRLSPTVIVSLGSRSLCSMQISGPVELADETS